jgi:hypothetical protein
MNKETTKRVIGWFEKARRLMDEFGDIDIDAIDGLRRDINRCADFTIESDPNGQGFTIAAAKRVIFATKGKGAPE